MMFYRARNRNIHRPVDSGALSRLWTSTHNDPSKQCQNTVQCGWHSQCWYEDGGGQQKALCITWLCRCKDQTFCGAQPSLRFHRHIVTTLKSMLERDTNFAYFNTRADAVIWHQENRPQYHDTYECPQYQYLMNYWPTAPVTSGKSKPRKQDRASMASVLRVSLKWLTCVKAQPRGV
ncbi:hypothetical protein CY34DRAFT_128726 [Suillus luteus UH-Slu-Lm8-n1]|uniref:Uncharacterized protein n=1 Tax=Suillus luteus UH-Slu-Lm8-n1 TaxID=930992 RepID=A0A0D0BZ72_9AGAM|nr:hypothetical protein CY34DRAFT_128726 [Suillus luteus UH-Slu-Lm8-n1]